MQIINEQIIAAVRKIYEMNIFANGKSELNIFFLSQWCIKSKL